MSQNRNIPPFLLLQEEDPQGTRAAVGGHGAAGAGVKNLLDGGNVPDQGGEVFLLLWGERVGGGDKEIIRPDLLAAHALGDVFLINFCYVPPVLLTDFQLPLPHLNAGLLRQTSKEM